MPFACLPILPRPRESRLTLLCLLGLAGLAGAGAGGGCSGGGGSGPAAPGGENGSPGPVGPVVDAGPEFPITASRLDARVYTMRPSEPVPAEAVRLIQARSDSLPEPLRKELAARGFLGALMDAEDQRALDHLLTSRPTEPLAPAAQALSPKPPPPPPTREGEGVSTIRPGAGAPAPTPEPVISRAARASPVGDIADITIRPGAAWEPLVDAAPRSESWALALGPSVAPLKPGTLRCFVRAWPAPAEPIPTAGMAAELRVQVLPVITGPLHEPYRDPLAPPPLSNDPSARGQVLGRQSLTTPLRGDAALVLIALPTRRPGAPLPGPEADAAPLLGQALLGPGPAAGATLRPSGPRVLVLKAVIPGTYRLLLDRGMAPN